MDGRAENKDPRAFVQVSAADAIGKLVAIIRQCRPQVMITFDETGGYGHPDHIAIYKYTTSAFYAAADAAQYPELGPAYAVDKLYYSSFPRSALLAMEKWMRDQDFQSVFTGMDPNKFGLPDELITTSLNVEKWQEAKGRSWAMHRTQMDPKSPMAQIPEEIQNKWRRTEYYHLAASRVELDVPG